MTTFLPQLTLPSAVFNHPAVSVLLPVTLGAAVGYSTRPSTTPKRYSSLKQPPLRPPPWVFGPAWTTLYALMGYAAYRAWSTGTSPLSSPATIATTKHGATLYSIQLGLNLIWMPLFFGLNKPIAATVDVVALVGINGYLTYLWGSVDKVAGYCLVPYVAWLSFATYLTAGAGYLNNWDVSETDTKRVD